MIIVEQRQAVQAEIDVKVRPAAEADINFIFNSWLKCFRNGGFSFGVKNDVYYDSQHKLIEKLLKTCVVNVVCSISDPNDIYGWSCHEYVDGVFCMHFAYVKAPHRNLGIARILMDKTEFDFSTASIYTHQTSMSNKLAAKFNMVYHPYVLLKGYGHE